MMTSRDVSQPKICRKSAEITKICEFLRKFRSLFDFAINSAIAESQNPGGTDLSNFYKNITGVHLETKFILGSVSASLFQLKQLRVTF